MKRNIPYLLIVCLLVLAGNACRKTKGPGEDPKPLAGSVAVQVTLPAGASFDFTGSQLLSFGSSYPVSKSGATMAQDFDDAPHIAYMIDKNNQLILAGFITDSTTSLSPATTAKVLLYFACGIHYRPDTMTNIFINRIYELPQATAWADEFTSLWKNDPQVLAKGAFTAPLRKTMESMAGKGKTLDIGNLRTSDIVVDQGDFLSGIQLFQENLGALTFRNNYRRRAHAFLYKMKRKLENGQEQVIISDINSGTKADKDLAIDPASANTSITGQIGTMIQPDNKADEIFSVKSGPVVLDLSDSESEVTWKVRVVGPGVPFSKQPTTNAEIAKQTRLEIETFAIDFMFPLIMETAGWRKELGKVGIDIGNGPVDKFIDATDVFLKVVPDAYEQVKKGEYVQALRSSMMAIATNAVDKQAQTLVEAAGAVGIALVLKAIGKEPTAPFINYVNAAEKGLVILKAVNAAMLGIDFIRIAHGVTSSHQLEEWEVKARSSKVQLLPREAKIIPLAQQKITAEIKNLEETGGDTHPYFEWSTTGKYGYLKDTKGNQSNKFESADKDVFYNCNAKTSDLGDGDNWEYIYVTARMGNTIIGRDTAKINVSKYRYKMLPNGVTLSGKENAYNKVKVYLERMDGIADIKQNPDIDYKIVWNTPGKHGVLGAKDAGNTTTVTSYDDNAITYTCTDEATKEATETITARIYSKRKDEADYRLFDEVTGSVKINNDEKKRIIHVPMTYLRGCWAPGNCYLHPVAVFPVDKDAKKYSTRFYNFTGTVNYSDNQWIYTWNAGGVPPTTYSTYPETKDIVGGSYYISFGRTWCAGAESGCNAGSANEWEANYRKFYGSRVMVEVTYYY